MSRRYDSRTTIFSPEGRLYQVEYAMEAIGNAGTAIGILSKDGVVLVGEKKVTSKLLQTSTSTEKMYKIDDHVACAVAGIMSDANILINTARVQAQRYTFSYQEPMPVEQLVQSLCDTKQGYTQFGGLRPFGVSFLFAGWDKNYGFQLYTSDPSGNYGGWKAAAIVGYPPGLRTFGWFINLLSGLGDGPGPLDGSLRKFIFQRIMRRDARIIDWAHVQFLFFPCFRGSEFQDFDDNFRMHEFDQVNELLTMLWCLRVKDNLRTSFGGGSNGVKQFCRFLKAMMEQEIRFEAGDSRAEIFVGSRQK
ncbi:hypothetical protein C3L33_11541, partial [Rhododendron williamsianum]